MMLPPYKDQSENDKEESSSQQQEGNVNQRFDTLLPIHRFGSTRLPLPHIAEATAEEEEAQQEEEEDDDEVEEEDDESTIIDVNTSSSGHTYRSRGAGSSMSSNMSSLSSTTTYEGVGPVLDTIQFDDVNATTTSTPVTSSQEEAPMVVVTTHNNHNNTPVIIPTNQSPLPHTSMSTIIPNAEKLSSSRSPPICLLEGSMPQTHTTHRDKVKCSIPPPNDDAKGAVHDALSSLISFSPRSSLEQKKPIRRGSSDGDINIRTTSHMLGTTQDEGEAVLRSSLEGKKPRRRPSTDDGVMMAQLLAVASHDTDRMASSSSVRTSGTSKKSKAKKRAGRQEASAPASSSSHKQDKQPNNKLCLHEVSQALLKEFGDADLDLTGRRMNLRKALSMKSLDPTLLSALQQVSADMGDAPSSSSSAASAASACW